MAEAANPETGAGGAKETPAPIVDDASAVQSIESMLEAQEGQSVFDESDAPTRANQGPRPTERSEPRSAEPETEEAEAEAEADKDEAEPETVEAEPDADEVELADTLEGLAEEFGVDPAVLAEHLTVEVTVNGEKKRVNLSEAADGYQLDADYRNKTSELAEHRRAFQTQVQQAEGVWKQRLAESGQIAQAARQMLDSGPDETDLARLAVEDPAAYQVARAQRDVQEKALKEVEGALVQQRTQAQQEVDAQYSQNRQYHTERMFDANPEFREPERLAAFENTTRKVLTQNYGFSDEEATNWFLNYDHRQVAILKDAAAYRGAVEGKKLVRKLKGKPKVLRPGAKKSQAEEQGEALESKRTRLRRTGTDQAALAMIMDLDSVKGL